MLENQKKEVIEPFLTIEELSNVLKVSAKTIYHWVYRKEIPYTKIGKHLRFNQGEVIHYFKTRMGDAAVLAKAPAPLFRSIKDR